MTKIGFLEVPLTLIAPPLELQRKYLTAYSAIADEIADLHELGGSYEKLFGSLMQRAFNGELTAPERKAA